MTDTATPTYRQAIEGDITIPGYGTGARKALKDAEKRNRQLLEQHERDLAIQTEAKAWIRGEIERLNDELADRHILERDARLAVKQYRDRFGIKGVEQ